MDLNLDARNPRLELADDASQERIREALLIHEQIVELAHSIVQAGGLYPSDNILVAYENKKFVVLEGNRRVCAMQLLLNPSLAPDRFAKKLPKHLERELADLLRTAEVEVAPNRAAAEPVIARLHAFQSRKPWAPLAKMRYANRLYEEHQSIEAAASYMKEGIAEVRRMIRRYRIYQHALRLGWTKAERERLKDESFKPTGYIRFFEQAAPKRLIGVS